MTTYADFLLRNNTMKAITKNKMEQLVTKGALLVDMRSPVEFRNAHVSGAVNLPLRNFINKVMAMPKTATIVLYSTSIGDTDIVQGLNYAQILGFTNLHVSDFRTLNT